MMVLGKHMKTVKSGKLSGEKLKLEAETGLTLFGLQLRLKQDFGNFLANIVTQT